MSNQPVSNFYQSLIAVVAGNALYLLLMPHLPVRARHQALRWDLGILVDFWLCLVVLGIVKTCAGIKARPREQKR
ncbi:MAG: hypothetical protein JOY93_09480 [Acidobacteriales bacterium]|nr:hypothetical protein [Terriglobales bacterium]